MLSKNKIKLIQSLQLKKNRDESQLFVAEGEKIIRDLSTSFGIDTLIITEKYTNSIQLPENKELIICTEEELKKASHQKQPQGMLAIFRKESNLKAIDYQHNLILVLDEIQDPGNLGTIIRIADWFGIRQLICSNDSADLYSSKVVQSTMGAMARVEVRYTDLFEFMNQLKAGTPVYGTLLDGENIYQHELSQSGIIIMGNEGKGISQALQKHITKSLFIPNYPVGEASSESLNVAIATAIVCAEFRRRT